MTEIFTRAGSFLVIILLGYMLKRIGFFKHDDYRLVSKIVLNITLPGAIVVNFSSTQVQPEFLLFTILGILGNVLMLVAAGAFSKKAPWKTQMFRMLNYSGYSVGCFTLPFIQSFLGSTGVVATCLFDAGNSMMCTGTNYAIIAEMDVKRSGGEQIGFGQQLRDIAKKMVRSVPFMTYIIMLPLSLAKLRLPSAVVTLGGIVGNANTFLAMFMIGMMFDLKLVAEKLKEMARLLLWRYVIAAAVALVFYFLLPFSAEIRMALALAAFSPLSTMALVYTDRLECDTELASACNSCSIIISLLIMTAMVTAFAV